jgi:hypothetical protein
VDDTMEKPRYTLVVRGPAQDFLYQHFVRLYDGRDDVVVVRDRRRAERRSAERPVSQDRRQADRRGQVTGWLFPPDPIA